MKSVMLLIYNKKYSEESLHEELSYHVHNKFIVLRMKRTK